jgi:hypothetical protein
LTPLRDITAVRDIRLIIRNGAIYDPRALLESAKGMIGSAGPEDHDAWKL